MRIPFCCSDIRYHLYYEQKVLYLRIVLFLLDQYSGDISRLIICRWTDKLFNVFYDPSTTVTLTVILRLREYIHSEWEWHIIYEMRLLSRWIFLYTSDCPFIYVCMFLYFLRPFVAFRVHGSDSFLFSRVE